MTARIVDCQTPGCPGKAEFLAVRGLYRCDDCGAKFLPHEIRLSPTRNGVTPFHGRAAERAILENALEEVRGGRTQVVLMHGEPGIGKTALMRAFYHELASRENDPEGYWPDMVGELSELSRESLALCASRKSKRMPFLWLAGQAPSPQDGACLSLHPWEKAFEGLRNVPLDTQRNPRGEKVAKAVGKGVLDIGADLLGIGLIKTVLETTVGVGQAIRGSDDDRVAISTVAPETARAMQKDVVRVVGILASHPEVPVLVVSLDDLQWADDATCTSIAACCRMATGMAWKLLLILGYRDNEVAANRCGFAQVRPILQRYAGNGFDLIDLPVPELDTTTSQELVRDYFPEANPELMHWLVHDIGGTPFYLHQFCCLLQDRGEVVPPGQVRVSGGVAALSQAVADGKLPTRLDAMLQERLNRLEVHQKRLLSYASVQGRTFTDTYLERVVSLLEPQSGGRDTIRRHLDDCERLHRLVKSAMEVSTGGWPFNFLHDLLHVAAGQHLSPAVRDTCLLVMRDWLLERWQADSFNSLPLTERRGVLDRLVSLVPPRVPLPKNLSASRYAELILDASKVYFSTGMKELAISALGPFVEAISAGVLDPGPRLSAISFDKFGDLMFRSGNAHQAELHYHMALASAERLATDEGDILAQRLRSHSYLKLGRVLKSRNELDQADNYYRKALAILEDFARDEGSAQTKRELGIVYLNLGDLMLLRRDLSSAEAYYRLDLDLQKRLALLDLNYNAQFDLAEAYQRLGDLMMWYHGRLESAEEFYRNSLEIAVRLPEDEADAQEYWNLGTNLYRMISLAILMLPANGK